MEDSISHSSDVVDSPMERRKVLKGIDAIVLAKKKKKERRRLIHASKVKEKNQKIKNQNRKIKVKKSRKKRKHDTIVSASETVNNQTKKQKKDLKNITFDELTRLYPGDKKEKAIVYVTRREGMVDLYGVGTLFYEVENLVRIN